MSDEQKTAMEREKEFCLKTFIPQIELAQTGLAKAAAALSPLRIASKSIVDYVQLQKKTGKKHGTEAIEDYLHTLGLFSSLLVFFINSNSFELLQKYAKPSADSLEEKLPKYEFLAGLLLDGEIAPFIQRELEARKHELENVSIQDILNGQHNALIKQIINDALQKQSIMPQAIIVDLNRFFHPLDKPNKVHVQKAGTLKGQRSGLWIGKIPIEGITYSFNDIPDCPPLLYSLEPFENLDGVKIATKLTHTDKRVYCAVASLWHALEQQNVKNKYISATQIYKAMGNRARPQAPQLQRITESVLKMMFIRVNITGNVPIRIKGKKEILKCETTGALLPAKKQLFKLQGNIIDGFWLYEEPPLIKVARERRQITTFPIHLLDSKPRKTEINLAIEDYLLTRIAHMYKDPEIRKITYKAIYEHCGLKTYNQQQRAKEIINNKYLKHYKTCILDPETKRCLIADFSLNNDGVIITLPIDKEQKQATRAISNITHKK